METREKLLAEYKDGTRILREALKKFPREMWDYRMENNEWSIHELVVHLADSELVGYQRCRKIIAENGAELASYDQNSWRLELDYANQDTDKALTLFELMRELNHNLLSNTADIYWNTHAAFHAEIGSMTLNDWISIYTKHPYLHIEEMEKIHQDWQSK